MKKIMLWLFVEILWPILREILIEVLKKSIRAGAEVFKDLLEKWRKSDEAAAKTQAERDAVNEKYRQRTSDFDEAVERIFDRSDAIVEEALRKSQESRDALLKAARSVPKLGNEDGSPRKPAV